jgi:hypothetical protein
MQSQEFHQLSPREYLQTLYDTGLMPDECQRPTFEDLLGQHIKIIEIMTLNQVPLVMIQAKILTDPLLDRLLDGLSPDSLEDQDDSSFRCLNFNELTSLPEPEWLIYDILSSKGLHYLFGKPGCCKTFVAIGMACSVALDLTTVDNQLNLMHAPTPDAFHWCGRQTKHEGGHVIYIAAEDIDEVAQRALAWAHYHQVADIPNLHFFPCPLKLATDTPRFMEALNRQYPDIRIALFVIDTLAMCSLGIDENSKKDFDAVLNSLELLWRTYNCTVMAVHHAGKNGGMRGTSSMDGIAYGIINVSEEDDSIVLKSIKKRRGRKFEDIYLERAIVETGRYDENGHIATTCVITRSDKQAQTDAEKISTFQQTILDVIVALGGQDIARVDVIKEADIGESRMRSFNNAIKALNQKDHITLTTIKNRTFYTLKEKAAEMI